jgi:hypothetical protein
MDFNHKSLVEERREHRLRLSISIRSPRAEHLMRG